MLLPTASSLSSGLPGFRAGETCQSRKGKEGKRANEWASTAQKDSDSNRTLHMNAMFRYRTKNGVKTFRDFILLAAMTLALCGISAMNFGICLLL